MLGRFADVSYAYRFGPPRPRRSSWPPCTRGGELLAQTLRFPVGRPSATEPVARLGVDARAERHGDAVVVRLRARRLCWGVRLRADGLLPDDDGFLLEPGRERTVTLTPSGSGEPGRITVTALNGAGVVAVEGGP